MPDGDLDKSLVPGGNSVRYHAIAVEYDGLWPVTAGVLSRAIEGDHGVLYPVSSGEISKVVLVAMLCQDVGGELLGKLGAPGVSEDQTGEKSVDDEEVSEAARHCLNAVARLRERRENTPEEIASVIGVSRSTLVRHLARPSVQIIQAKPR